MARTDRVQFHVDHEFSNHASLSLTHTPSIILQIPLNVFLGLNWDWNGFLQGRTLETAWTGDYFMLLWSAFVLYFLVDLVWVAYTPTCVKSPGTIVKVSIHSVHIHSYMCVCVCLFVYSSRCSLYTHSLTHSIHTHSILTHSK